MKNKLIESIAVAGLLIPIVGCRTENIYGKIVSEIQVSEGNVTIGVKDKEASGDFTKCDPRTLRAELGLPNNSSLIGKEVRYNNIQKACPDYAYPDSWIGF